jgi:uncharacterized membrane protein
MRKFITPVTAILFFIGSVIFIAHYQSFHFFLPSQQVELSHGVAYGAVLKDFLFVQEITMQKRFISRVDLYMAKLPSQYANENVFVLLDEQHRILFTKRFSSGDFGEALYFPFNFNKSFDIGSGRKIYACVYSLDGDQGSYIGLAKKENSNLGKLFVVTIVNNDIVQSFEKRQSLVNFTGSIGARTYESDTKFFSFLQIVFYLIVFAVTMLILFAGRIALYIRKAVVIPEYAFLGFALVFGLAMLIITPPFMVPDEPVHFFRSYQVSELNIFKGKDDFPKSLTEFSAICDRMQFSTHEKTTRKEILSLGNIKTNPSVRISKTTPDYTFPYIPQAVGIAIGKIFGLSLLWLFYLGRLFNLMVAIVLIFLAIRITPVFKWVFFLLGIMPMTLFQLASLSYDAITIGLCFLLLATILDYALRDEKSISSREVAFLFILALLLALAKQPYVIMVLAFFIIPFSRFGSLKKYLTIIAGLAFIVALFSMPWTPLKAVFSETRSIKSPASTRMMATTTLVYSGDEIPGHQLQRSMLPLLPHTPETMNAAQEQSSPPPAAVQASSQPQPNDATQVVQQAPVNPIDPQAQKNFILHDPLRYIGILVNTLEKSLELYLTSFVGLFGWIDAPLPPAIAYMYLLFLVLFSLLGTTHGKVPGLPGKSILLGIFILGFVLIETALYVYCNTVGCDAITAVQGRYFIAIAPLFFLLFSNITFVEFLQEKRLPSAKKPPAKKQQKQQVTIVNTKEILLIKSMPWLAILVALVTLTCSVFIILERFYVLSV